MKNYSSYLATNKSLASLLTRSPANGGPLSQLGVKERWTISNGRNRVIYDSGWLPLSRDYSWSVDLPVNRYEGKFRVFYHMSETRPFAATRREMRRIYRGVPPPSLEKSSDGSVGILSVSDSDPNSVSARENSRRTVRAKAMPSSRARKSSVASSVRPASENFSVPYDRIDEFRYVTENITESSVTPSSYVRYQREWTGTRTPGFRRLKKRDYPINGHHVRMWNVKRDQLLEHFKWHIIFNGAKFDRATLLVDRHTLHYAAPSGPTHLEQARSRALRNLINKAGNEIQANLAQDLAQLGQLLRLMDNTIGRLTGSLRNLRKGNLTEAADRLFAPHKPRYGSSGGPSRTKSLARNWLELQYGWKPLLQDIHGSMDALAKLNIASSMMQRVTASSTVRTIENVEYSTFGGTPTRKIGTGFVRTSSTCRFGVRFRVDDPLIAFLAQTGFTNPINLAWEVLPFSFVADWFIPIGPWLETLSAWHGLSFMDGFETRFTKQEVVSAIDVDAGPGFQTGYDEVCIRADYVRDWIEYDRIKLTSFPTQNLPQFKNPFSTEHLLNGIALLRALF